MQPGAHPGTPDEGPAVCDSDVSTFASFGLGGGKPAPRLDPVAGKDFFDIQEFGRKQAKSLPKQLSFC